MYPFIKVKVLNNVSFFVPKITKEPHGSPSLSAASVKISA